MDILTEIDPQLHFIGLGYDERSKTLKYRLYSIFWFTVSACIIVPEVIYFQLHLNDLEIASDTMIFMSAVSTTIVKLIVFHQYKDRFAAIIQKLKDNANQSERLC